MAAGQHHTCALSTAGRVVCWGRNTYGQTAVPGSVRGAQVAVVAGEGHTCALSAGGAVACWGRNDYGQSAVPGVAVWGQVVAMAAGFLHTCALSAGGAVTCWGRNDWGQTAVPPAVATGGQVAVAAGYFHTCALSIAGTVSCWGKNGDGQSSVPPFYAVAVPCFLAALATAAPSPSAAPTPGYACAASLFRPLLRTDLVGAPVGGAAREALGTPALVTSEETCRVACCAVAGCSGYAYVLHDPARRLAAAPASLCFLYANVTQLVPSSTMVSGIRESALL